MKEIPLTQGLVAIVDDEDYDHLNQFKWCKYRGRHTHYAKRAYGFKSQHKTVLMHRAILDAPAGIQVDHINGNGLDNRRENLRLATHVENLCNFHTPCRGKSGYIGVFWVPTGESWGISISYKKHVLRKAGFKAIEDAAKCRDFWASVLHGKFARLNFPIP